ncbi:MAG: hypothetical protein JO031_09890, partial [Ktedonobacteraceae bacterium]|nr:hypothetical protein [Ktedonobacteraceae bacterium]
MTLCDEDAIFCGNCGKQIVPLKARGATVVEPVASLRSEELKRNTAYRNAIPRRAVMPPPPLSQSALPPLPSRMTQTPAPAQPDAGQQSSASLSSAPIFSSHKSNKSLTRDIFISILLFLLVVGASAGLVTLARSRGNNVNSNGAIAGSAGGLVSFSDSQDGLTNSLKLKINGLGAPPMNLHYYAWIIDTVSEKTVSLGPLVAQDQNFHLNFTDKNNLLAVGNQLEITQEQGTPTFPTGEVVLSGTLPPLALIHIRHLLVRFDTTPGKVGLLVGLRNQTHVLSAEAKLLKNLSSKGQLGVGCAAQSIVNVIEGKDGQNTLPLADVCASFNVIDGSDGFGLLNPENPNAGYVVLSAEHASLAAIQSDATKNIRIHAQHIQTAMANLKKWVATIDNDARQLVAHPGN